MNLAAGAQEGVYGIRSRLPKSTQMANPVVISPASYTSLGAWVTGSSTDTPLGNANDGVFIPFFITQTETVRVMAVQNGSTVAGNVDVGIYRDRYDGTLDLVASHGGKAQAGSGAIQSFTIQPTDLRPGRYYMAISASSSSAQFTLLTGRGDARFVGVATMASAYPLPAVATILGGSVAPPLMGLAFRDFIA